MNKYYFAFISNITTDKDALCVVPVEHWKKNKCRCTEYVLADTVAEELEKVGLQETIQCVFEYNAKSVSKTTIKNKLKELGDFRQNKDFSDYINKDDIRFELINGFSNDLTRINKVKEAKDFDEFLKKAKSKKKLSVNKVNNSKSKTDKTRKSAK